MGLSVVHGIVKSHKGDILVDSVPGEGSAFHVYLPVVKNEIETEKSEPIALTGGLESILLVDDEEPITTMLKKMLETLGYRVTVHNTSLDALTALRLQPDKYDLLISDLTMPNMSGMELSIKLQKLRPGFPVIIMTGYGDSYLTSENAKDYGIRYILNKPIVKRDLVKAIRRALTIDGTRN